MLRALAMVLLCLGSLHARGEILPMPLLAADPARPIELIADQTWSGAEVQATRAQWSKLAMTPFVFEAAKGPVRLVVDYAALRTSNADGDALMDVGIECPEATQPCAIPITSSVISIRSHFMGEHVARVDGELTAVWVGRELHQYSFPDQTRVHVWLTLLEHNNLDPKAIRARLVYGQISHAALPGQKTRSGTLLQIAIVLLTLTAIVFWWLRR